MPDSGVFDMYRLQATAISPGTSMTNAVLSPDVNPWGATNAKGFYYVETSETLKIERVRLHGTLIVRCSGKGKVEVKSRNLLENYDSSAPVLLVDGDLDLGLDSDSKLLDEAEAGVNYNPVGTPYEGAIDADQSDTYPNEVRGLVHVLGKLKVDKTRIRGTAISEESVELKGDNALVELIHDEDIYNNPPTGYGSSSGKVRPGSWKQAVD